MPSPSLWTLWQAIRHKHKSFPGKTLLPIDVPFSRTSVFRFPFKLSKTQNQILCNRCLTKQNKCQAFLFFLFSALSQARFLVPRHPSLVSGGGVAFCLFLTTPRVPCLPALNKRLGTRQPSAGNKIGAKRRKTRN